MADTPTGTPDVAVEETGPVDPGPGTPTAAAERPNARKVREGVVDSTKMDKTVVVKIVDRVRHPLYGKTLQRTKRLYVHDEQNDAREGDRVRIQETRPLSKTKRWRLLEIVERAR